MRFRGRRRRAKRHTHWATGFSALADELDLSPLNGTPGGTYATSINFTNAAVLAAEGGEGMVVARLVGDFVPHFCTTVVDGSNLDRGVVLRLAFVRSFTANSGATAVPDLFNNMDLGSEDIMWMRQHVLSRLTDDVYPGASVAYPNDVRSEKQSDTREKARAGAFDERRSFDVTAKRRVDDNQSIELLLQARQWPGYGPPDPSKLTLEFTAWVRMLILRALR